MYEIIRVKDDVVWDKFLACPKEASARVKYLKETTGESYRMRPMPDDTWPEREVMRLRTDVYTRLPQWWSDMEWWHGSVAYHDHYAHLTGEPGVYQIEFIEHPTKGPRDIKLIMSVSAYLGRFFGDKLTGDQIAKIALRLNAPPLEMKIDSTPEMFAKVYSGQRLYSESSSHVSCMAQTARDYDTPEHPAYAYGAGDLSIAYLQDELADRFTVLARCIIWPKKMKRSKIYSASPAHYSRLESLLDAAGHEKSSNFRGARLLKYEFDDKILVPYIDGEYKGLDDDGENLIIRYGGEHDGGTTDGWIEVEDSSRCTCEHCGSRFSEDEGSTVQDQMWCDDCVSSDSFYCERFEEQYPDHVGCETVISRNGNEQTWSRPAAEDGAFLCERTDRWYDSRYFNSIEVNVPHRVQRHNQWDVVTIEETWCQEECGDACFECEDCGEYFSNDLNAGTSEHPLCKDCLEVREEDGQPLPQDMTPIHSEAQLNLNLEIAA